MIKHMALSAISLLHPELAFLSITVQHYPTLVIMILHTHLALAHFLF